MFRFIGRFFKYLLWFLLVFIVLCLFIWLAKFDFNTNWYINFLNDRDRLPVRNQINIFQPNTVWFVFRWSWWIGQLTWDILDILSWTDLSWLNLSWEVQETWLDIYDPSFQAEFDNNSSTDLNSLVSWADNQSWFGFSNTDTWTNDIPIIDPNAAKSISQELKNLINEEASK